MDNAPIEQQHDIVICETPEQTTDDECGNDGNRRSIENPKTQSQSDRYLISNI